MCVMIVEKRLKNNNQFYLDRVEKTLYFWYGDSFNYHRSIAYGFVEKYGSGWKSAVAPRLIEGTDLEYSELFKSEKEALKWGISRLKQSLMIIHDGIEFDNDKYKATIIKESNAKLKTSEHSEKAPEKPREIKKKRKERTNK